MFTNFDKFLFILDLKYGAYSYGATMTVIALISIFDVTLKWHSYLYLLLGQIPVATSFILVLLDSETVNKIKGMWYCSALSVAIGMVYTCFQTLYLIEMTSSYNDLLN